jgi:hypothetical protein
LAHHSSAWIRAFCMLLRSLAVYTSFPSNSFVAFWQSCGYS